MLKAKDQELIDIGGVFRCCLAVLEEYLLKAEHLSTEGQHVPCKYCRDGGMTFRVGVWRGPLSDADYLKSKGQKQN